MEKAADFDGLLEAIRLAIGRLRSQHSGLHLISSKKDGSNFWEWVWGGLILLKLEISIFVKKYS